MDRCGLKRNLVGMNSKAVVSARLSDMYEHVLEIYVRFPARQLMRCLQHYGERQCGQLRGGWQASGQTERARWAYVQCKRFRWVSLDLIPH